MEYATFTRKRSIAFYHSPRLFQRIFQGKPMTKLTAAPVQATPLDYELFNLVLKLTTEEKLALLEDFDVNTQEDLFEEKEWTWAKSVNKSSMGYAEQGDFQNSPN